MDEFEIIAGFFAPLASPFGFGLKDDAAAIPPRPGFDLVVTTDTVTAGVDFFADDPPASIAKKALRVNLSDLAAKGAAPAFYLLNLSLPAQPGTKWIEAFARGLGEDQEKFEIALIGGDTGRTPGPLSISVTAFGYVPEGQMIRRSGAKPGDAVFVTGTIGESGAGLDILKGAGTLLYTPHRNSLIDRYRLPAPPVWFGQALHGLASASVDVSDGLIADLGHVADASGVRVIVDGEAIPRSPALSALWGKGKEGILRAATAGDDYEIAFMADPAREREIMAAAERAAIPVARIGQVTAGSGVVLIIDGAEIAVPHPGYRHF